MIVQLKCKNETYSFHIYFFSFVFILTRMQFYLWPVGGQLPLRIQLMKTNKCPDRHVFFTWSYRYSYMIDNVILLITGTLHQRAISELVPKCQPLVSFEQMEAVNIAQTPAELYNAILDDTPLGKK